jgi:excisionase family DNA binding protein
MGTIMNIGEVSGKIRIAVSTLRKYVMLKKIPFRKVGTRVIFDEEQIDEWLVGFSDGLESIRKRQENRRKKKAAAESGELFPEVKEAAGK